MSPLLTLVSRSGLVDLAVKSAAAMLLAWVAAALLVRDSAAWRHLVWCLGVVSLLLLPLLSLALPAWRVTWLPRVPQWAAEQTPLAATDHVTPTQTNQVRPVASAQTPVIVEPVETYSSAPSPTGASDSLPGAQVTVGSPLPWLGIGWLVGTLFSLIPLLVGLFQLVGLYRRSRVIDDRRWLVLLADLRRQLAVRRSVELRQCAASLPPLTWGALKPVLLLPAEACEWPQDRCRLVLLHELAHVRRWDWLTQLVAHATCALYWFNPLVWLAARQMRIERERACDDLVLACGTKASEYAQELVALAAGLSRTRVSTLVAVPMARRSGLEDRLHGLLDNRRSRAALTLATVCLGAAVSAAAIGPLAMLRAAPPEPSKSEKRDSKQEPPVNEKPDAEKPADKAAEKKAEQPAAKTVTIRGKVVDDATGKPIERLVTQAGKFDPADPTKVTWGGVENRSEARDGSFSATVRWAEGWTYRIVADGYISQPVLTSAPPAGKTEIKVTIRLKRGPIVRGVVLDHSGKPLQDAAVFVVGPTLLNLAAGQAWRHDGIDEYARPVRTDKQGRFELPVGEAKSLAVSHAQFDAWPAAIPPGGEVTIQLPKPARVEIELDIEGADQKSVTFYQLLAHDVPEFAGLQSSREVSIGNPGKLSLAALPPGKYQLCRNVQNRLKGIAMGAMLERQYFELQPGETKVIHYVREQGARVRGQVPWPADTTVMGIVISIQEEKPQRRPSDVYEWRTIYASHAAEADGAFLTERIAPGTYLLVATAYTPLKGPPARLSTGTPVPSYGAQIKIDVPAGGELAVGELALKPIPSGK